MSLDNKGKSSGDIVLLYPKTGMDLGGHTVAPPHSLLAVAAPVHKEGYKVKIVDMRRDLTWNKTLSESISEETICVGISTMTGSQIYYALLMAAEVRKLTDGKIPIVWGGAHPTILPEQTLENELVDIVIIGEGEIAFFELVKALEKKLPLEDIKGIGYKDGNKIKINPPRELLDVNTLLPIPWELINVKDYINRDNYFLKNSPRTLDIGQTSRGCPYRCGFCSSSSNLRKKWRPMSLERSMEAIVEPVKKFKLTGIWIRDDEFYVNNERAFGICEEIVKRGLNIAWYSTGMRVNDFLNATKNQLYLLKSSGGTIMKFGAESGNNRVLDLIQKGFYIEDTIKANLRCKKYGVIPAYSFIIGFPTETVEEINNTLDFGLKLKQDNPDAQLQNIATYTAFPQTPMYGLALSYGLKPPQSLEGWIDWVFDNFDSKGKQIPWFNKKERKYISNINYMSMIANTADNVKGGIENSLLRTLFTLILGPMERLYNYRLKNRYYRTVPEIMLFRYLRKKIFYESTITLR